MDSQEVLVQKRAGSQPKQRKVAKPVSIFGTDETLINGGDQNSREENPEISFSAKKGSSPLKTAEVLSASSSSSGEDQVVKFVAPKKRKSLLKARNPPSPVQKKMAH
mmetsp:Transcript_36967/g.56631  ORF Transcript_36967/g.56631 Transcript_36967/m.56631 type:complete len:107 (-) Transcript_36967:899-1219(-)